MIKVVLIYEKVCVCVCVCTAWRAEMVAVDTVDDARELIAERFANQLDRAIDENAAPNEPVEGDARARALFNGLLPLHAQRTLFLECIKNPKFWPRARTLCGPPPYAFLAAGDNDCLSAAGICRSRTNMSRLENAGVSTSVGFVSHFHDDHERSYKIVAKKDAPASALPWRDLSGGHSIVADVRLKPRRIATKLGVLSGRHGISKKSLAFPRPGEEVSLSPGTTLASFGELDAVTARVVVGRQSAPGSNLARLVLVIV